MTTLKASLVIAATCIASLLTTAASAQSFPSKPIKLVVPAAAGGPTDAMARILADGLARSLGQPTIVDNRAGAGGVIGARAVAIAPADGYTLMFGNTATLATIPATSKTAGYDPSKSFTAIAKAVDSYQVVVVRPDLPVKTLPELVAYAKANPGKLNFGAVGVGNLTHLSGELLKARAGLDFVTVHYKSGAESMNAILGGQIDFAIDNVATVRAFVTSGKLRALAVTSAARTPEFPQLPTMAEAGVPGYVVTSFFGVVAPAGTPAAIVSRLHDAINEVLRSEAFQTSLRSLGAQSSAETPEQFRLLIQEETRKWTEIAQAAHISID